MTDSLEVRDLVVRFGGVTAVDGLHLTAPVGTCTGLIGPNGAGKTTTFNACTGLLKPTAGTVAFGGRDITRLAPPRRARLGIGRTFQRMQLFDRLTVEENLALGAEAGMAGSNPWRHVRARPAERADVARTVAEVVGLTGIGALLSRPAGTLSTGQRRLVELARALAGDFRLLLLDEPSSGLDREETKAFGGLLADVLADRGVGLLLIEHDIELVMAVSSYVYVLDFGRLLFHGTPADVQQSEAVQQAYLGVPVTTGG